MAASDPHTDLQTLPHGWRNLWRAEVDSLPEAICGEAFTIFVRADGRDAAHLAIQRALQAMFPAAYQELDGAYCNLSSALELVEEGLSERHVDRLFESGSFGGKVDSWVRSPVFVVPEAPALYATWMTAQLDHSSQYASRAFVPAPDIVADEFPLLAAQLNAKAQAKATATPTAPIRVRHHDGFLIAGDRLVIQVQPSAGRDQIDVDVSATAEALAKATGRDHDRGVRLGQDERLSFEPDDIRIKGDVLTCAAQAPFMAEYAPGMTDYREGFTVTLEPGQADAIRQAVAQLRRVLAAHRAAVDHLRPRLSSVEPSTWLVEKLVFHLAEARVLDGVDPATALASFDEAISMLPADARPWVEDPALWAALDRAAGLAPL